MATSHHINKTQIINLIDGAIYANLNGIPLNRRLDFNLASLKTSPQKALGKFTHLAGDWLYRRGIPNVWVWFLENPPKSCLNCHMLYHVPEECVAAFSRKQRGWAVNAGLEWRRRALKSRQFKKGYELQYRSSPDGALLVGTEIIMTYRFKGADRRVCDILGIDCVYQGEIVGKRVGISESISRKARTDAGFVPPKGARTILFRTRYKLSPGYVTPAR